VIIFQTNSLNEACGIDPRSTCKWLFDLTGSNSFSKFGDSYLITPLKIIGVVIIAAVVLRFLQKLIRTFGSRFLKHSALRIAKADGSLSSDSDKRAELRATTLVSVISSLTTVLVFIFALATVVNILNISLAPLFAGAGVLGIVIGFGAQAVISDFLSGFFMLFEDQFGVGDVIDAGEVTGKVEDVSLRTTTIRDVNGTVWHIRNSEIKRVANKSQLWSRAVLDIEVAYDTDLRRAEGIIQRVAEILYEDKGFTKGQIIEPPEVWGVQDLGPNGVSIRLVVKTEPAEQFVVARELKLRIKEALEEAEIEMPFPQTTVWLRQDNSQVSRDQRPIVDTSPIRTPKVSDEFADSEDS